jgi:hypothetical protein
MIVEVAKIWVTWALHGVHCYPSAPADVAYLRDSHRHLFKFKATLGVEHDNRDIEFHQVQNKCIDFCKDKMGLDYKSCEMMAREVLTFLEGIHSKRYLEVEVSEDGECGAIVSNNFKG